MALAQETDLRAALGPSKRDAVDTFHALVAELGKAGDERIPEQVIVEKTHDIAVVLAKLGG